MEFWMELGVDGFRMDAVPRLFEDQTFPDELPSTSAVAGTPTNAAAYWEQRHTFNLPAVLPCLAQFRQLLDRKSTEDGKRRVLMAEAYVNSLSNLMKYYGTPQAPIAHFPFNFKLSGLPIRGFRADAHTVKKAIDGWMGAMPAGAGAWPNWLVGNHDRPRVADRFGPEFVDAVNAIVLLLPGTAVTYYGEELGMWGHPEISYEDTKDVKGRQAGPERYQRYSRDPQRTPMQWDGGPNAGFSDPSASGEGEPTTWLPLHPNYRTLNVEAQLKEAEESHLKVYKALVALRQTFEWMHGGLETRVFDDGVGEGQVFGFTRSLRYNDTHELGILVLANLGGGAGVSHQTIDATVFRGVPSTGVVCVRSVGAGVNSEVETAAVDSSMSLKSVVLRPGAGLVIRYARELLEPPPRGSNIPLWIMTWCVVTLMTFAIAGKACLMLCDYDEW